VPSGAGGWDVTCLGWLAVDVHQELTPTLGQFCVNVNKRVHIDSCPCETSYDHSGAHLRALFNELLEQLN
jgi:hypothetical protein